MDRSMGCLRGCSFRVMEVRPATRGDLVSIARVAHAAAWAAWGGLLRPETITASLEGSFRPSAIKRLLLAGGILAAVDADGTLVGFAAASDAGDHVVASIHTTEPPHRHSESVRALIAAIRSRHPGLPVCVDVMLGDLEDERSCEVAGLVPGEVIQRSLFGEEVVERRWWTPVPG